MQNALSGLIPAIKKIKQRASGNLITGSNVTQNSKPFVSLEVLTADGIVNSNQSSFIPASGQAIITYVISGQATYADSKGKHGILEKDGWAWIIAGSGIWYSIEPTTSDYAAVQLCIALAPALENSLPQSFYLDSGLMERDGPAQVLIGRHGDSRGKFSHPSLINYLIVHLDAAQDWIYELPMNHHIAWIAVISGSVTTSDGEVTSNEITMLNLTNKKINVCATVDSIFVLGSTQEFEHDLILHKNSVHTSTEALRLGLRGIAEAEKFLGAN